MAAYRDRRAHFIGALLFLVFSGFSLASYAAPRFELFPPKQNNLGYLGFQSKWQTQWFQSKEAYLGGYWDTSLSRSVYSYLYHSPGLAPVAQEFGVSAVLRYQRQDGTGFYAEAGVGPQYQLIAYDWAGRPQGSRLLLNTSAGVGFVWKNGVDLGFKASYLTRGQGADGGDPSGVIGIGLLWRW